jgi:hypothetical protein
MRRISLLLLILISSPAGAHESTEIRRIMPVMTAGLGFEFTTFDLGRPGQYIATSIDVELNPLDQVGFGFRIPFFALEFDDGDSLFGPGDTEWNVRYQVVRNDDIHLALGLAGEVPTGDTDSFMGGGHFVIGPIAALCYYTDPIKFHLDVSDAFAIVDDHGSHHGAEDPDPEDDNVVFVDPHSDHEIIYHFAMTYRELDWVTPKLQTTGVILLTHDEVAENLFAVSVSFGFDLDDGWGLSVGGRVPLTSESRYDFRTWLNVSRDFGSSN